MGKNIDSDDSVFGSEDELKEDKIKSEPEAV